MNANNDAQSFLRPTPATPIQPAPSGPLSRPVFLPGGLDVFAFHDEKTLYAYTPEGLRAWWIAARIGIRGFAAIHDNLYLQDGDVLCQYDPDSLIGQAKAPINALSLRGSRPQRWSATVAESSGFDALFAAASPQPPKPATRIGRRSPTGGSPSTRLACIY